MTSTETSSAFVPNSTSEQILALKDQQVNQKQEEQRLLELDANQLEKLHQLEQENKSITQSILEYQSQFDALLHLHNKAVATLNQADQEYPHLATSGVQIEEYNEELSTTRSLVAFYSRVIKTLTSSKESTVHQQYKDTIEDVKQLKETIEAEFESNQLISKELHSYYTHLLKKKKEIADKNNLIPQQKNVLTRSNDITSSRVSFRRLIGEQRKVHAHLVEKKNEMDQKLQIQLSKLNHLRHAIDGEMKAIEKRTDQMNSTKGTLERTISHQKRMIAIAQRCFHQNENEKERIIKQFELDKELLENDIQSIKREINQVEKKRSMIIVREENTNILESTKETYKHSINEVEKLNKFINSKDTQMKYSVEWIENEIKEIKDIVQFQTEEIAKKSVEFDEIYQREKKGFLNVRKEYEQEIQVLLTQISGMHQMMEETHVSIAKDEEHAEKTKTDLKTLENESEQLEECLKKLENLRIEKKKEWRDEEQQLENYLSNQEKHYETKYAEEQVILQKRYDVLMKERKEKEIESIENQKMNQSKERNTPNLSDPEEAVQTKEQKDEEIEKKAKILENQRLEKHENESKGEETIGKKQQTNRRRRRRKGRSSSGSAALQDKTNLSNSSRVFDFLCQP